MRKITSEQWARILEVVAFALEAAANKIRDPNAKQRPRPR